MCEDLICGVTAVILAGGKGKRLGYNKALLKMGDTYLLEIIVRNIKAISDRILFVVSPNDYSHLLSIHSSLLSSNCVSVICDSIPNQGPLLGLIEALKWSNEEWIFLVGCDMPFIEKPLVKLIYQSRKSGSQVLVPRLNGFLEPLHAFYHRSCLKAAETAYKQGKRKIKDFYPFVNVSVLEEKAMRVIKNYQISFFNINSAEDLQRAQKIFTCIQKMSTVEATLIEGTDSNRQAVAT
ncbi:molybdenum cofactor guanylyltransferase [Acetomicrobium sp.]|uniref:molybdenum cofactor guanylyltransferase n=1 Tax=Acetomicrobium sp. TaxID=1872099 RepID=UPI002B25F2DE|nr:molybdenum cofactor guanylyltransferase [Acetomicrobium sp.]